MQRKIRIWERGTEDHVYNKCGGKYPFNLLKDDYLKKRLKDQHFRACHYMMSRRILGFWWQSN